MCRGPQAHVSKQLTTGLAARSVKAPKRVGMPARLLGPWAKVKANPTTDRDTEDAEQSKAHPTSKQKSHVERREDGVPTPLPQNLGLRHAKTAKEALTLNTRELSAGGHGILYGSRVPLHFFTCHGFGETDQGDGADPWETGSYDLALEAAGSTSNYTITRRCCRCWHAYEIDCKRES